jgi:Rrf2 family iron-sulfur cluster assembly transcriptional regulator
MIQLTKRGDYGILAVYQIAQYPKGKFVSIDEISTKSEVPKSYLSKILQDLCRGGILLSRRGTGGGFMLARPAREISLRDLIEIIEGKLCIVTCMSAPEQCIRSDGCVISPFWSEVQGFIDELMESITIEDLIDHEKRQDMLLQLETCRKLYKEKARATKEKWKTSSK